MLSALQDADDPSVQAICMAAMVRRTNLFNEGSPPRSVGQAPSVGKADSMLVHGTCFAWPGQEVREWWTPGSGEFHGYLTSGIRPNLYAAADYFRWSGGWNDYARDSAARELTEWLASHKLQGIDLFAHSHGANVALRASHSLPLRNLVLLSCPVHDTLSVPSFANVRRVLSIRIHWDLVILADRGRQHFRDPRIIEKVLPIWFVGHGASVEPRIWDKRHLAKFVETHGAS
jgi:pimeloyl-ACP methyl ester carboxylesterase